MKKKQFHLSKETLICLLSVFLIIAGLSRYIETDSGNILIHDIEVESFDCYLYGARLFRPLQASSMNQRPSILIVPGDSGNRYTGDHIAMEFARRGFVVLTIENDPLGTSGPVPDEEPENPVDSAYTFLTTRFFTDQNRVGLITYYSGAETALSADHFSDFTSRALVSPKSNIIAEKQLDFQILIADHETDPSFRLNIPNAESVTAFPCSHTEMIFHTKVIAALMEQFHEDLAIPNDSPFWFSSISQHAHLLLCLRFLLLIMLFIFCSGLNTLLTKRQFLSPGRKIFSVIIPLSVFLLISELMNFFIISVRLGSPFHYLPPISLLIRDFSLIFCGLFIIICIIWSIPVKPHSCLFIADISAVCALGFCLFVNLPLFFGNNCSWELLGMSHLRQAVILFGSYAAMESFLLRISSENPRARICHAILTGLMFYINCSSLTAF